MADLACRKRMCSSVTFISAMARKEFNEAGDRMEEPSAPGPNTGLEDAMAQLTQRVDRIERKVDALSVIITQPTKSVVVGGNKFPKNN